MTSSIVTGAVAWVGDHWLLVVALLAAGLIAGFLAGLLGIGGGGILVPVFYEVFGVLQVDPGVQMHLALGTTMAVLVATTLRSFLGHWQRGSVDMVLWRRFLPWTLLGVFLGIAVAKVADGSVLKLVWVVVAAAVAAKLALGRDDWRLGEQLPKPPWLESAFFTFGGLSTLMSIGGGTFVVPYLTLFGRSILSAVSSAASFGPLIAVPGVFGYVWAGWGSDITLPATFGYVSLAAALVVAPVSVVAAPFGVRLAHGINRRRLELAFAAFLGVVSLRFFLAL